MRVLRKSFSSYACCQACDAALPGQGVQALKGLQAVQQVPADGFMSYIAALVAATALLPGQDTRPWWTEDCTAGGTQLTMKVHACREVLPLVQSTDTVQQVPAGRQAQWGTRFDSL